MRRHLIVSVVLAALALSACGGADDQPTDFVLSTSPEFVNRLIPGHRPLALVTVTGEGTGTIRFTAVTSVDGAAADVRPADISPGGVAEIWVDLPLVTADVPFTVTITGTRDDLERTVTVDATAVPGVDDLEAAALDIAGVFVDELAGSVDALPPTTAGLVNGTPVAGLLVVTHYAWFTDEAEIGLAWHIMVAPDDWAELTIRPRDQLAPTEAYRLTSWSTALAGGEVAIDVIDPPPEVVR